MTIQLLWFWNYLGLNNVLTFRKDCLREIVKFAQSFRRWLSISGFTALIATQQSLKMRPLRRRKRSRGIKAAIAASAKWELRLTSAALIPKLVKSGSRYYSQGARMEVAGLA
jgi:hypothetical protein